MIGFGDYEKKMEAPIKDYSAEKKPDDSKESLGDLFADSASKSKSSAPAPGNIPLKVEPEMELKTKSEGDEAKAGGDLLKSMSEEKSASVSSSKPEDFSVSKPEEPKESPTSNITRIFTGEVSYWHGVKIIKNAQNKIRFEKLKPNNRQILKIKDKPAPASISEINELFFENKTDKITIEFGPEEDAFPGDQLMLEVTDPDDFPQNITVSLKESIWSKAIIVEERDPLPTNIFKGIPIKQMNNRIIKRIWPHGKDPTSVVGATGDAIKALLRRAFEEGVLHISFLMGKNDYTPQSSTEIPLDAPKMAKSVPFQNPQDVGNKIKVTLGGGAKIVVQNFQGRPAPVVTYVGAENQELARYVGHLFYEGKDNTAEVSEKPVMVTVDELLSSGYRINFCTNNISNQYFDSDGTVLDSNFCDGLEAGSMVLRINGKPFGSDPPPTGNNNYIWSLPPNLAQGWKGSKAPFPPIVDDIYSPQTYNFVTATQVGDDEIEEFDAEIKEGGFDGQQIPLTVGAGAGGAAGVPLMVGTKVDALLPKKPYVSPFDALARHPTRIRVVFPAFTKPRYSVNFRSQYGFNFEEDKDEKTGEDIRKVATKDEVRTLIRELNVYNNSKLTTIDGMKATMYKKDELESYILYQNSNGYHVVAEFIVPLMPTSVALRTETKQFPPKKPYEMQAYVDDFKSKELGIDYYISSEGMIKVTREEGSLLHELRVPNHATLVAINDYFVVPTDDIRVVSQMIANLVNRQQSFYLLFRVRVDTELFWLTPTEAEAENNEKMEDEGVFDAQDTLNVKADVTIKVLKRNNLIEWDDTAGRFLQEQDASFGSRAVLVDIDGYKLFPTLSETRAQEIVDNAKALKEGGSVQVTVTKSKEQRETQRQMMSNQKEEISVLSAKATTLQQQVHALESANALQNIKLHEQARKLDEERMKNIGSVQARQKIHAAEMNLRTTEKILEKTNSAKDELFKKYTDLKLKYDLLERHRRADRKSLLAVVKKEINTRQEISAACTNLQHGFLSLRERNKQLEATNKQLTGRIYRIKQDMIQKINEFREEFADIENENYMLKNKMDVYVAKISKALGSL